MESAVTAAPLASPPASIARRRVADWMTTADARLRGVGDASPAAERSGLAAMLREGVELAAEELRAEEEARLDELVRAESALTGARELLDAMPVALLVTDLDGRVRDANDVARRLLGLAPVGVWTTLLVRHVPLDERPAFRRVLAAAALQARTVGAQPADAAPLELPLRLRTPDGARAAVATVRGGATGGERLLFWALRDDHDADMGDLL